MDSGNVDFSQLGINTIYERQISVNRRTTCAVLDAGMFKFEVPVYGDPQYRNLASYASWKDSTTGIFIHIHLKQKVSILIMN